MDMWDGIEVTGAQSKKPQTQDSAPRQESMRAGLSPAQQRSPSGDQKRVRRQMARQAATDGGNTDENGTEHDWECALAGGWRQCDSWCKGNDSKTSHLNSDAHKESSMAMTEHEIIQAMGQARSIAEQSELAERLDQVRAARREQIEADSGLDFTAALADTEHDPNFRLASLSSTNEVYMPTALPRTASLGMGVAGVDDFWDGVLASGPTLAKAEEDMRVQATLWYESEGIGVPQSNMLRHASAVALRTATHAHPQYLREASRTFLETVAHLFHKETGDPSLKRALATGGPTIDIDEHVAPSNKTTDQPSMETFDEDTLGSGGQESVDGTGPSTSPSMAEGTQPAGDSAITNAENSIGGDLDKSQWNEGDTSDRMETQSARKTAKKCPECNGSGVEAAFGFEEDADNGAVKCKECGGSGEVESKEGSRRQASDSVQVANLPTCDICQYEEGRDGVPAAYDGKTKFGPWANMCERHFSSHGTGLGTGKGQRLTTASRTAAIDPNTGSRPFAREAGAPERIDRVYRNKFTDEEIVFIGSGLVPGTVYGPARDQGTYVPAPAGQAEDFSGATGYQTFNPDHWIEQDSRYASRREATTLPEYRPGGAPGQHMEVKPLHGGEWTYLESPGSEGVHRTLKEMGEGVYLERLWDGHVNVIHVDEMGNVNLHGGYERYFGSPYTGSRRTAAWIDQAREVVDKKQHQTVDGTTLDMQTANLLVQVYDALSGENKTKFGGMSISQAADIAWKIQGKQGSRTASGYPGMILSSPGGGYQVIGGDGAAVDPADGSWEFSDLDSAIKALESSGGTYSGHVTDSRTLASRRQASGDAIEAQNGSTCSVCGDKIAKDPSSEDPATWHHDNGESHDHEAKPKSEAKESAREGATHTCEGCGRQISLVDGSWVAMEEPGGMSTFRTSCVAGGSHRPEGKTSSRRQASRTPALDALLGR